MNHELLFDLFLAISTVETACNPASIGDNGKAVGIVQIHPAVVADVNHIAGTNLTLEDRNLVKLSWYMFRKYLEHYSRDGELDNPQVLTRMWNGGPRGWMKPSTVGYWKRVEEILNSPTAMEAARRVVTRHLTKELEVTVNN